MRKYDSISKNVVFPFTGKKTAQISTIDRKKEREKLSNWCVLGVFTFDEGYEVLSSMFFYRCSWLKCIIFPKTMKTVDRYSCVPYIDTERKPISYEYSQYKYPCDYRNRSSCWEWEITKFMKKPLSVVIRSPQTKFDPCAFGDGNEEIYFFLEFDSDYDISNIKSKVTVFKYGDWNYYCGIPTPQWSK